MKRHVIVQSVNAQDRTALVRVVETGAIELASVLELDPRGTNDWSAVAPTNDGLGVLVTVVLFRVVVLIGCGMEGERALADVALALHKQAPVMGDLDRAVDRSGSPRTKATSAS